MIPDASIGWQGWSRRFGLLGKEQDVPASLGHRPVEGKVLRRIALTEPGQSRHGRGDLWATKTGQLLHATDACCLGVYGMPVNRRQVKDFPNPRRFDGDQFRLCQVALETAGMPEAAA